MSEIVGAPFHAFLRGGALTIPSLQMGSWGLETSDNSAKFTEGLRPELHLSRASRPILEQVVTYLEKYCLKEGCHGKLGVFFLIR